MSRSKRRWIGALVVVILGLGLAGYGVSRLNRFQTGGTLVLPGLSAPVTVVRDEKGMPYIHAENYDDALLAQGFVDAQDRLFQMELTRLFSEGRIAELAGESAVGLDTRMRTIGFYRQAVRHAAMLDEPTRRMFEQYVSGINAYVTGRPETHPLEFKLAGIEPGLWTVEDSLAILYYLSWNSAANLYTEIVNAALIEKLGAEKAAELFPVNVNPDVQAGNSKAFVRPHNSAAGFGTAVTPPVLAWLENDRSFAMGSNNWVVNGKRSKSGRPILANDPHLDIRILPGPWHSIGFFLPENRIVGVSLPGTPGVVIGRNSRIAWGVTNAYSDTQDLYIETVDPSDPGRYLEGELSRPFEVIRETLDIKDKTAAGGRRQAEIVIRTTRRGPVISEVFPELGKNRVVTLRWAPFETMAPSIPYDGLLKARSASEARDTISRLNLLMLNYVFADKDGNIGWYASGRLPVRTGGDGSAPFPVKDGTDNWRGFIPAADMPQVFNPARGWVGTCNHYTVGNDYPYYYTSYASPSFRYRRLMQLLEQPAETSPEEHWAWQLDTKNLMAEKIAPIMARALQSGEGTGQLADILAQWDFNDHPDAAAPAVFQAVYRRFAINVFQDELGEETAALMLKTWYFWQERLLAMVLDGESVWFDDVATPEKTETMDDLFRRSAVEALNELKPILGEDPAQWVWGKVHRLQLVSPIRREGFGKEWLGTKPYPFPGSGETLYRGLYDFSKPYDVTISASLRMVIDLGDDEKVMAVLPAGETARLLNPHTKDQTGDFISGGTRYWWFSEKALKEHTAAELTLTPR